MAIANILTIGTDETASADIVVAAGTPLTVCLKDAAGPRVLIGCLVHILLKNELGEYFRVGQLTAKDPAAVIDGAGTYQFKRGASVSCGVFQGA